MKVVLDTHVLIWMMLDSKKLSRRAHESIRQARADAGVAIADISLWKLAWLIEHRRVSVFTSLQKFLEETASMVIVQPVTAEIAALSARLPATFSRNPADRLIAATALSLGVPLVTADERISHSQAVGTIW